MPFGTGLRIVHGVSPGICSSEGDDDGDQDYSFPFTNPESAAARERDDENTKRLMDNLNGTNRDLRRTTRNGIALKGVLAALVPVRTTPQR